MISESQVIGRILGRLSTPSEIGMTLPHKVVLSTLSPLSPVTTHGCIVASRLSAFNEFVHSASNLSLSHSGHFDSDFISPESNRLILSLHFRQNGSEGSYLRSPHQCQGELLASTCAEHSYVLRSRLLEAKLTNSFIYSCTRIGLRRKLLALKRHSSQRRQKRTRL